MLGFGATGIAVNVTDPEKGAHSDGLAVMLSITGAGFTVMVVV
jgi:hypothetical protein